jgi:hypothetical protein
LNKHYHLVGLIPDQEIQDTGSTIEVNVTSALHRTPIHNDVELLKAQEKGECLWVSGGGTYLLNRRYLLTVRRPLDAKVNPGKFSLFTGRADSTEELLLPGLLIRELFEELLLFSGERICKPICKEFQGVIDRVYTRFPSAFGLDFAKAVSLPLQTVELIPKTVAVINGRELRKYPLNFHVGPNKDVNILFLLAGQIDLATLFAQDGEYHIERGQIVRHKRNIYLYDVGTSLGQNISLTERREDAVEISSDAMTSHMRYLVESVSDWLAAPDLDNRLQSNII